LLPVDDGSVRVVCDAADSPFDQQPAEVRAFAFDAEGRSLAGWPVQLGPTINQGYEGRVVGHELTLLANHFVPGTTGNCRVTTVAADGLIRRATDGTPCGGSWAVGSDGVAYGVGSVSDGTDGSSAVSQITSRDQDGVRAGWPVSFDGIASGPAFGSGGQIVVIVGSVVRRTSRVLGFHREGKSISASSAELPIATADSGVDCVGGMQPPLVAQDGTIFVFSEIDTAVLALDPSLEVMSDWPYRPATPLERPDPWRGQEGLNCSSLAVPAVGPDSTLYLPLQARDAAVGGSIVAVGPDGRVRPGWPVELHRPGAEFWSVAVGSDGTAYVLAIEPETGDASSATILAIAPDSTVLRSTTIVEP
jgi:hypothetical protein